MMVVYRTLILRLRRHLRVAAIIIYYWADVTLGCQPDGCRLMLIGCCRTMACPLSLPVNVAYITPATPAESLALATAAARHFDTPTSPRVNISRAPTPDHDHRLPAIRHNINNIPLFTPLRPAAVLLGRLAPEAG